MGKRWTELLWGRPEQKVILLVACGEGLVLLIGFLFGLWFFLRA